MPQKESMTVTTLWRGSESKSCHSEKEIEAATKEGFHPYNAAEHDYPRFLYKGAESVKVGSADAEAALTKEGYSRKPGEEYGKAIAVAPLGAPAPTVNSSIEERLAGLAARVTALEALAANPAIPVPEEKHKGGKPAKAQE